METNRIKLLITIIDKNLEKKVIKLFNKYKFNFQFVITGIGTASSSILDYFGLDEIKKTIILNIIPEHLENNILYVLCQNQELYKPGKGIAFTIPISSSNKYLSMHASTYNKEKEDIKMVQNKKYHLILSIVNEGYSETVMNSAKKNGATGGTVINGRGTGTGEITKFLGISIEPEKDIILILASEENKNIIMEEINKNVGISTEGKGICFSLPTDSVIGLDKDIVFEK